MRRVAALAAGVLAVTLISGPAGAEILHGESSQDSFGFDETGSTDDSSDSSGEFVEAWELFAGTVEGARILGKLDASRDFEITIEVLPADEFKDGDEVYGRSTLFKNPNDQGQKRAKIIIRADDTGGVENLADTIYHEMRHVEFWMEGDFDEGHDQLHADTDSGILRFKGQLPGAPTSTQPSIPAAPTPIYDAVVSRNTDDNTLVWIARDLGDLFNQNSDEEPTFVGEVVEVEEYLTISDLPSSLVIDLNAPLEEATPIESDGRCVRSEDTLACGSSSGFRANEGDVVVGVRVGDMIPLEGFDTSLEYFAAFDSDSDPANNRDPFSGDFDPYQGTDLRFLLKYDYESNSWRFNAWQVGPEGSGVDTVSSGAFAIVQEYAAWFVIPRAELPGDDPRFRAGAIAGDRGSEMRGIDVTGELPTDPLIRLDGTRIGGAVTGSGGVGDTTVFSYGPTLVPAGGTLETAFCLSGSDGSPLAGLDVATTLGEPPSSDTATHNNGTTDENGCISMPLDVNEAVGESSLYFFDGTNVVFMNPITVR